MLKLNNNRQFMHARTWKRSRAMSNGLRLCVFRSLILFLSSKNLFNCQFEQKYYSICRDSQGDTLRLAVPWTRLKDFNEASSISYSWTLTTTALISRRCIVLKSFVSKKKWYYLSWLACHGKHFPTSFGFQHAAPFPKTCVLAALAVRPSAHFRWSAVARIPIENAGSVDDEKKGNIANLDMHDKKGQSLIW